MCGFVGTNVAVSDEAFAVALDRISHRGPDDSGTYTDGDLRLGFHRLAIQDLSEAGHQPMASPSGDVWIVFNGEIYNHHELRERLATSEYRGTSDTETILAAYLEHGVDVFAMLHGIFAIAIYDSRTSTVTIARDHLGVKPLYFHWTADGFAFGSELKAIDALPDVGVDIDGDALVDYLEFLWSPGEATPNRNIRKVEAGHLVTFGLDGAAPVTSRFYDVPYTGVRRSESEEALTDELDRRLTAAVERQLLSDVPVGLFVSGGLDSSLVAAAATRLVGGSWRGYTIGGASQVVDGFDDDLGYARTVAEHLGIDLVEVVSDVDAIAAFDEVIWHLDEPQADPAALHVWNICRRARENGDVVLLGGTAADDIFSGYRRHQILRHDDVLGRVPVSLGEWVHRALALVSGKHPAARRAAKVAAGLGLSSQERAIGYYSWSEHERVRGLMRADVAAGLGARESGAKRMLGSLANIPDEPDLLNQVLYCDTKYFLTDHNLNYTDKMAMAAGVEVRVPFLDLELVEFACQLPVDLKMRGATTKYLLRKVGERYLPPEIVHRPKTGFGAPVRSWVNEGLLDDRIARVVAHSSIFEPSAVAKFLADCKAGRIDGHYTVWAVCAIDSWIRQFSDGASATSPLR